jgi:DNA-binding transcriptional LysR family regulator
LRKGFCGAFTAISAVQSCSRQRVFPLHSRRELHRTSTHCAMNVHHLELFYYVARFGGISEAVRNMPYGIQQPAISSQIIQLEEFLGVTLFQRRPFELTPAGEELYGFVAPFFSSLDRMTEKLQGGTAHSIRVGASEVVLRDHLPTVVETVRKKFPKLKMVLREGYQPQLEQWIERHEIDLAFTLLNHKATGGAKAQRLLELPLVLLVEKKSKLQSPDELFARDKIEEPLIALPSNELICKLFQQELSRRGVDWFPSVEVSSIDLVETYVGRGYGIGLSLGLPQTRLIPNLRQLPLRDFPTVTIGAVWAGKPTPLTNAFVEAAQKHAKQLA